PLAASFPATAPPPRQARSGSPRGPLGGVRVGPSGCAAAAATQVFRVRLLLLPAIRQEDKMAPPDWKRLIEESAPLRSPPIRAETYGQQAWTTGSRPALLRCSDRSDYVVKGKQVGRALIAEQIIGALGALLGAPVPKMPLVDVPADLIKEQHDLSHMHP